MTANLWPESEYYLHENGCVIYKPHGGVDQTSPFVRRVWDANTIGRSPEEFIGWLTELKELGANHEDLLRLADEQDIDAFVPGTKRKLLL